MPRPSPVTDTVRSLFESRARHSWSLAELHESTRARLGEADPSTIFRAVTAMEREGLLAKIEVGDGKARYELRDDHHEHVRCDVCGKVAEVPGCSLEDVEAAVRSSTGYAVTSHQLIFTGVCPDCASV
jgi:Fur family ferric uptake transcriptional regulator